MGDTVRGVAYVDIDKECKCDSLKLKKYWATHGKGNSDSGNTEVLELFSGVWQPGSYSYPFKFDLQEGPFSYHGHLINIDWYVDLRADIPWAIDPRDKKEFIVEKGQDSIYSVIDTGPDKQKNTEKSDIKISPLIVMMFPLTFGLPGLYFLIFEKQIFFGGIFTFVGLVMSYKFIQSYLAEKKLGQVKYKLNTNLLKPGDNVKCTVSFTPRKAIYINSITVSLTGREVAVSGSGTNESTYRHRFHIKQQSMLRTGRVEKGMHIHDSSRFEIPADAVASFKTKNNDIIWEINIQIDISKWPDWINTIPITVVS